jgi:branched-chain amino acid transport system permease protein
MTSTPDRRPARRPQALGIVKVAGLAALTGLVYAVPYLTGQYYVGIATEMLIFGLWAVGLNVLVGTAGLYSLGHAALLGISAYAVIYGQTTLGLSFLSASVLGILATMVVALAFAVMAVRATAVYFLMITLAQGMLVWGVAQSWVSVTDGDNGLRGGGPDGALQEYYNYYWLTASVVLICLVALKAFLASRFGLRLRGVRDSSTRMASLGYNVLSQRTLAFLVAALPAAVAGALYVGYFRFISPTALTVAASVEGLLMVILGGVGFFLGPMLGALLLIGLRSELTVYTDRWPTIVGILLVLSVLFARQGVSRILVDIFHRLRSSTPKPRAGTPGDNTEFELDGARLVDAGNLRGDPSRVGENSPLGETDSKAGRS